MTEMTETLDLWYGTRGRHDAKIAIIGESWGENEQREKRPLVGRSGEEMEKILSGSSEQASSMRWQSYSATSRKSKYGIISKMDRHSFGPSSSAISLIEGKISIR